MDFCYRNWFVYSLDCLPCAERSLNLALQCALCHLFQKLKFNTYKVKKLFQSHEYKLKSIIKKKLAILMDKEIPLLYSIFPNLDLTKFSKKSIYRSFVSFTTNSLNNENFATSIDNKLYNLQQDIHQHRVRSVVRISRRSSEPQVMGSKPTGPVWYLFRF